MANSHPTLQQPPKFNDEIHIPIPQQEHQQHYYQNQRTAVEEASFWAKALPWIYFTIFTILFFLLVRIYMKRFWNWFKN